MLLLADYDGIGEVSTILFQFIYGALDGGEGSEHYVMQQEDFDFDWECLREGSTF